MTLAEFLKAQGLTDEQITKITDGMKQNKLFIVGEENLDVRYGKLKTDHDALDGQLKTANGLIEELKGKTKDSEDLQKKIAEYEQKVTALEAEKQKLQIDGALRLELLKLKAKPDDIDYLIFKLQQGEGEIKLDDKGNIKGADTLLGGLKTAHPSNFETDAKPKILPNPLPSGSNGDDPAPKSLEQAIKARYAITGEQKGDI